VILTENPADCKAAKRLAKLYDAILYANPTWSDGNHAHELNLFMTRILFCFYAEDTGIFNIPQLFTNTIAQHTNESGSDLATLLDRLFMVMKQKVDERPLIISTIDKRFPYVNGSLFEDTLPIPTFNRTARRLFLECGELDWQTINPDIFGSMIQTIAQPCARVELGMHYTSVPNIMKLLQPLFLDELNDAYEKAKDNAPKLYALLERLEKIRVFDPACGCGNFLIIAYKELRQIEMRILRRIGEIVPNNPLRLTGISLNNFFGIDIADFACETSKLSLWIAEYQMNSAFKQIVGTARSPLPLGKITTIRKGNALELNWFEVCPNDDGTETYICGNPPYVGTANQTNKQKSDVHRLFSPLTKIRTNIDYVGCFFLKAAGYLQTSISKSAFVSTNSICQGEQVPILWPLIYDYNVEISFAYPSFKWQNNASHNAGVTCVIVGLARVNHNSLKSIYTASHTQQVSAIGPYLIPGTTCIVEKTPKPINNFPEIIWGSQPLDGGWFLLSPRERADLISRYPHAESLVRSYVGSDEFINHVERYCLWITDENLELAESIPEIKKRIELVRAFRRASSAKTSQQYSNNPHRFRPNRFNYLQDSGTPAIIIPCVTSERRSYLTVGITDNNTIINNAAFAIYNAPLYILAILSSRLHWIWAATVGGKLENRIRYSNSLVYNTFPVPALSAEQKRILADHSKIILKARAKYPNRTIAWLYNPETMPGNLIKAHQENDAYLEEFVYGRAFRDDIKRLEHLFAMYVTMKAREETTLLTITTPKPRNVRK
jgi:hypothetical protein